MKAVFSQQPGAAQASSRAAEFLPPPYSRIGAAPVVSGKWIPNKPILITAIVVTTPYIIGPCRFALIVGGKDITIDTTDPSIVNTMLLGGNLERWIDINSVYTRIETSIPMSPTSWMAIGEFVENPCSNPVIMFEGELAS